jgi:hypothetical protein
MEREMEIMRLEEENKALREMLAIAEELHSTGIVEEEKKVEGEEEVGLVGTMSRKGSLTVEELQASAEAEEEERKMMEKMQPAMVDIGLEDDEKEKGAVDGEGVKGKVETRESVLGFSTEVAPPEEVIEETTE